MTDNTPIPGLELMQGTRVSADRSTGVVTTETVSTLNDTQRATLGDVDTTPPMSRAMAAEQHALLAAKLTAVDEKLAEKRFDARTGEPAFVAEGRAREILNLQRGEYLRAIDYIGVRASELLPKQAAAGDEATRAAYARELNIATLSQERGADGRPMGRVRASALIDEAAARAKADKLVRGL